jgi:thiamine-phosphate pyrophosphorylase
VRKLPAEPLTCLITAGIANAANFAETKLALLATIRAAVDDGISIIQIREKSLPARLLFELAIDAVEIANHSNTALLINDRADIAKAAGADGVHLPSNSIPARIVRSKFGGDFIIGISSHTLDEVKVARDSGADFALFSPVFATPGKETAKGLEGLKAAVTVAVPLPVIALGGINETNFTAAFESGAAGIAAIRSLNDSRTRKLICAEISSGLR